MPPRKKIAAKPPAAAAKAQSTNTGVNNTAANAAAAVPLNGRALPTKEAELFRQVLNYYETKQFKTGLAAVQQILDLYPEHGGEFEAPHANDGCFGADCVRPPTQSHLR